MYDKSEKFKKSVESYRNPNSSVSFLSLSPNYFTEKKAKDKDTGCYKVFTVFVVCNDKRVRSTD